ncbi:hypothetical protein T484DRAFT_1938374 [Baffinella frigidus]|nr:hypothetical protein T484DRAFT_1938374 [Cryptophyta sp. CCMP2293]
MTFMSPSKFPIYNENDNNNGSPPRRQSIARRAFTPLSTNSPMLPKTSSMKQAVLDLANAPRDEHVDTNDTDTSPTTFTLPPASPVQATRHQPATRQARQFTAGIVAVAIALAVYALSAPVAPMAPAAPAPPAMPLRPEGPSLEVAAAFAPTSLFGDEPAAISLFSDEPSLVEVAADSLDSIAVDHPFVSVEKPKEEEGWEVWEEAQEGGDEEGMEGDEEKPWDAALISGPVVLPAGGELHADFNGFARLTQGGELFLFAHPDSEVPEGMILLDTCGSEARQTAPPAGSERVCFDINTPAHTYKGCVEDGESAMDWLAASHAVPCHA